MNFDHNNTIMRKDNGHWYVFCKQDDCEADQCFEDLITLRDELRADFKREQNRANEAEELALDWARKYHELEARMK